MSRAGSPPPPTPPPPGAPEPLRLLKRGKTIFQPDIWIVDGGGAPRVWKTWWRRPWLERVTFGRWLARHEGSVMRHLEDLEGFPRVLGYPDAYTVEMSLLDAEPVPETKQQGGLDERYFEQLGEMLAAMHARGINHGDLRRKNLLRAPGDPSTPRIVDFTQCFRFHVPVRGLRAWLLGELVRVDRVTFVKLKRWYLGKGAISSAEQEMLDSPPWHLVLGRALRQRIYRPLKHLFYGRGG